jgi:plasmid stabilization system protein ParE
VNVILLDEAQRQLEAEDAWWREHRDAKDLLIEEFEQALRHLSESPSTGQRYRWNRGKLVQRWLMRKTGCYLYYFHDRERGVVEIHSLWGARRGQGPRL